MICKNIPTITVIEEIDLWVTDGALVDVMRKQDLSASDKCVMNVFPIAAIASVSQWQFLSKLCNEVKVKHCSISDRFTMGTTA